MADEQNDSSFGRQVFDRAWFGAWNFFGSRMRDIAIFGASLVFSGLLTWFLFDLNETWAQVMSVLIFTVAPAVAIWLLLFLWHFWLAPSAIAYEAARKAYAQNPEQKNRNFSVRIGAGPPVNWAIWKQRNSISLMEFAAILAKNDPGTIPDNPENTRPGDERNFLRLLQEEAGRNAIPTRPNQYAERFYTPALYPGYFDVQRADAIKWAEAKGFDVAHFK